MLLFNDPIVRIEKILKINEAIMNQNTEVHKNIAQIRAEIK